MSTLLNTHTHTKLGIKKANFWLDRTNVSRCIFFLQLRTGMFISARVPSSVGGVYSEPLMDSCVMDEGFPSWRSWLLGERKLVLQWKEKEMLRAEPGSRVPESFKTGNCNLSHALASFWSHFRDYCCPLDGPVCFLKSFATNAMKSKELESLSSRTSKRGWASLLSGLPGRKGSPRKAEGGCSMWAEPLWLAQGQQCGPGLAGVAGRLEKPQGSLVPC